MSQDKTTQGEAVNSTAETTVTAAEQVDTPVAQPEKSIEEVMGIDDNNDSKTIGLDKFLDIKKENKQLKRDMKNLAERIEQGGDTDVSGDLEALADEHNVDKAFLAKLVKRIEAKAEKSLEERINEKLEPITKKEQEKRLNDVFSKAYSEAMERMPEFNGIANADVIKALATNPANAKKTLTQIVEEAYGGAIQGRATIESTKSVHKDTTVDVAKAKTDSEYFAKVMADPTLKAQYNKSALNDVLNYL